MAPKPLPTLAQSTGPSARLQLGKSEGPLLSPFSTAEWTKMSKKGLY